MNEIDVLDMSFPEIEKQYTPMFHRVARRYEFHPRLEQEDLLQEERIIAWNAHRDWTKYQEEHGARQLGKHVGRSFSNFLFRRLQWRLASEARSLQQEKRRALTEAFYLHPDYDPSDQNRSIVESDAELEFELFLQTLSPATQRYARGKVEGWGTVPGVTRSERERAKAELRKVLK